MTPIRKLVRALEKHYDRTKRNNQKSKNAPVFNKEDIESGYSGLEVSWKLDFVGIQKPDDGGISHVSCVEDIYPWVYFSVKLEDYPKLKLLNEGQKIIVKGIIESVDGHTIKLKNIREISFGDTKSKTTIKKETTNAKSQNINKNTNLPHKIWEIVKFIFVHPVWSLPVLVIMIFLVYFFTGVNLKDFSL